MIVVDFDGMVYLCYHLLLITSLISAANYTLNVARLARDQYKLSPLYG